MRDKLAVSRFNSLLKTITSRNGFYSPTKIKLLLLSLQNLSIKEILGTEQTCIIMKIPRYVNQQIDFIHSEILIPEYIFSLS